MLPILTGPSLAPASCGVPRQLVVLLHGYGSNGADLIALAPLWQRALPEALFLAPDAPERCPGVPGGRQWWALTSFSRPALAAGAARAAPVLDAFLDRQLEQLGLGADRLLLVGFSQGTMLALHVAPRRSPAVAGVVGYSGMLAGMPRPDEIVARPPVLLIHGDADPIVPVAMHHEARAALTTLDFAVDAHVSPGLGHFVDEAGLELGARFAARALGVGG